MALTAKQQRFVVEYLVDLNATQAAIRAGFSARRAREYAYQLMQRADVTEAIQKAQTALSVRTKITQEKVLERLWLIATADPNELIEHRRICCRHCFGDRSHRAGSCDSPRPNHQPLRLPMDSDSENAAPAAATSALVKPKAPEMSLTVKFAFGDYQVGQHITDTAEVAKILAGESASNVLKKLA